MKKTLFFLALFLYTIPILSQDLPSVAGVTFGSSYSTCKNILDKRFGDAVATRTDRLMYAKVNIGGIFYDYASFEFQYVDGVYKFNEAFFYCTFEKYDLSHAMDKRMEIRKVYGEKYKYDHSSVMDGNTQYYYGTDPLDNNRCFIVVFTINSEDIFGDEIMQVGVNYGPLDFTYGKNDDI